MQKKFSHMGLQLALLGLLAGSCAAVAWPVAAQAVAAQAVDAAHGTAAAATPATTAAVSGTWTVQATPRIPYLAGGMNAISCVRSGTCMAVAPAVAPGLNAVQALTAVWDGTTWRRVPVPNVAAGTTNLLSVSCASATFCAAVGYTSKNSVATGGVAATWNGKRWTAQAQGIEGANGVSCPSPSFCLAVGPYVPDGDHGHPDAKLWNGTTWSEIPVKDATVEGNLLAVSCSSASACTAVGTYQNRALDRSVPLIERWNGTALRLQQSAPLQTPAVLYGVSCPTAHGCVAVGDVGAPLAELWTGTKWQLMNATPAPIEGALLGVSCSSLTQCSAVGFAVTGGLQAAFAEQLSGSTWSVQPVPGPAGVSQISFDGVSCVSAADCEAVGSYGAAAGNTRTLAEEWNGAQWSSQPAPNVPGPASGQFSSVSCGGPTACQAVGNYGYEDMLGERWNGGTWTLNPPRVVTPRQYEVQPQLLDVSCSSPTACMAVGYHFSAYQGTMPFAEVWNGTRWSLATPPKLLGKAVRVELYGVSCTSATACLAVGAEYAPSQLALAYQWNGTSWTRLTMSTATVSLNAVSCSSATSCVAVGCCSTSGWLAEVWNGTSWTVQTTPATPVAGMNSVSCTSPSACTAVGSNTGLVAARWNGTSWTVQTPAAAPPGAAVVQFGGVSCSTATACTAVGAYSTSTNDPGGVIVQSWNGSTWTNDTAPDPGGSSAHDGLDSVSCTAPAACTAAGDQYELQLPLVESSR
ncbi:MAG: hypothetical protein ACRDNF_10935 [Streptosporangiaceae bacterium]